MRRFFSVLALISAATNAATTTTVHTKKNYETDTYDYAGAINESGAWASITTGDDAKCLPFSDLDSYECLSMCLSATAIKDFTVSSIGAKFCDKGSNCTVQIVPVNMFNAKGQNFNYC